MTSQHRGRNHLRLITSPPESGAEHRRDAPDAAMSVLTAPTIEDLTSGRPHLFSVKQLEQEHEEPRDPDFTHGSVEGSLNDVLSTPEQGARTVQETRENFQESDFFVARRRRAAEKAGQTLGLAYGPSDPTDIGADLPTQQFPLIPHRPDDAS